MKTGCIRYGYRRCADDFVAFDNKQHETVRTVRHNQSTFSGPPEGAGNFFSIASLANTAPPISIFVFRTLHNAHINIILCLVVLCISVAHAAVWCPPLCHFHILYQQDYITSSNVFMSRKPRHCSFSIPSIIATF